MFKSISTVIIATSMAVCSFGVTAGPDVSEKNRETMRKETLANPNDPQNISKEEGHKYDTKAGPISEKDRETMRKETMRKELMAKETTGKESKETMGKEGKEGKGKETKETMGKESKETMEKPAKGDKSTEGHEEIMNKKPYKQPAHK